MTAAPPLDVTRVLQEALSLPLPERSYIAERLLVSLDEDSGELSPAWREELEARVRRRQSGETRSHERQEVRDRVEALLV